MGILLHKLKQEQSAPPGAPGAPGNAPSTGVRSWASGAGGAAKQGTGAAAVAQESDYMLRPLMDFLDARLTMFADSCDKTVLKRILKVVSPVFFTALHSTEYLRVYVYSTLHIRFTIQELWRITIIAIEKTIVLPPTNPKEVHLV